jgi:hypothetical protein
VPRTPPKTARTLPAVPGTPPATAGTLPAMPETPSTTAGTSSFPNLSPEDIWPLLKYLKNKSAYHAKEGKLHSNLNIVSLKKSKGTRCLILEKTSKQNTRAKTNSLHDLHSPQRSQVKMKNRMKMTSVSTVVMFIQSTEGWIQCSFCRKWAHNSCAVIDSEDDEVVHMLALCVENLSFIVTVIQLCHSLLFLLFFFLPFFGILSTFSSIFQSYPILPYPQCKMEQSDFS